MIEPDKLAAFLLVTATTSLVPGVSMLFVTGQAITRGARAGWLALAGMQVGYLVWWVLAALGLGTLAAAYPLVFDLLALGGALFLAYLGSQAIRHSLQGDSNDMRAPRQVSRHAFRDGIAVAIGNPKSLVYMVAIIPPFITADEPIVPQIGLLALLALLIDLVIGAAYIAAGRKLTNALQDSRKRVWLDRFTGLIFIAIAALIIVDLRG